MKKGGHFVNMLIRPLHLGRFWPILCIKFFEVYLSQSNRETFCCNLFQVKCYISPAVVFVMGTDLTTIKLLHEVEVDQYQNVSLMSYSATLLCNYAYF